MALGVGVAWGDGKLRFKGKEYVFSIEGLSLVDLGYSKVSAKGEVYDLNRASNLAGTYVAGSATFAVAGGIGEVSMKNQKGVVILARSEQKRTKLSLAQKRYQDQGKIIMIWAAPMPTPALWPYPAWPNRR